MLVKVGDLRQPKGASADKGVPGLVIGTDVAGLRGPASAVLAGLGLSLLALWWEPPGVENSASTEAQRGWRQRRLRIYQ